MKNFLNITLPGLVFLLVCLQSVTVAAKPISVQVQVDRQEVSVGEPFRMQLKIDGDDTPADPDLSGLRDFDVQQRGSGQNNRESITIVNGKVNRVSERGYIFNYELTAQKEGLLTIPAIAITVAGKTLLSQPVTIKVSKPQVTEDFKLLQNLSRDEAYVGQPLVLTVSWYINRDIEEFQFRVPVLEDQRFEIDDFPEDRNYSGTDGIAINLHGSRVVARKKNLGQYIMVTLRRILIPVEPGTITLEPATVSSRVVTGYRRQPGAQPGSPFNNRFFDDMFSRRQPVFAQLLTASNPLTLQVRPLPEENVPHDFAGLVGEYSLAADASPAEVNVGDPITLNIMVTGAEYLDNVVLPPLHSLQGMDKFKVPEEMGQGKIDDRVKIFTQTIRAKDSAITEIPGITLTYFNPGTGRYETARSNAIPLKVNTTNVITAMDAEGIRQGGGKSELTTLDEGIAHNYVGQDLLVSQHIEIGAWFSSPLGLMLIILPPTFYLLLLLPVYTRRKRMANEDVLQARRALQDFSGELTRLKRNIKQSGQQRAAVGLVDAIRHYLGKRLNIPAGSLVFADVDGRLKQHGVDRDLRAELQKIMDYCEACHYGGIYTDGSGQDSIEYMMDNASALLKKIDLCFKK